jgi:SAM-dependent methyltransferase
MVYSRDAEIDNYRYKTRERVFQNGFNKVVNVANSVEADTGATLEGRRVLDYGCGVGRLSLPLAERCEHVYGLDVVRGVLEEAAGNAERMDIHNVEWIEAHRLAELSGQYDFVLSVHVLQHIRSREGERIFAQLVRGLRPGGVAWINVIVRPPRPIANLMRWIWRSPTGKLPRRKAGGPSLLHRLRIWDLSYAYMMRNSYSLDRLGRILAAEGVTRWRVRYKPGTGGRSWDGAALVFRKD